MLFFVKSTLQYGFYFVTLHIIIIEGGYVEKNDKVSFPVRDYRD